MNPRAFSLLAVITLIFLTFISDLKAQVPDPAYNPMTAPGAKGIHWNEHTLYWKNSPGTIFNEVYFSDDSVKVANKDTTVRVRNGFPSTIYSSYPISAFGNLDENKKYFWHVVEYNGSGNSNSSIWFFNSQPSPIWGYQTSFDTGFDGWQISGPMGFNNWYWANSTHTGMNPGEVFFRWDPVFIGDSYLMSPEIISPAGSGAALSFRFYEDWWADTVIVGCAITTDNGLTWETVWDLYATGNVGPDNGFSSIEVSGTFRLGFFYTGNSDNIDFFYVDNVQIATPLSPILPPTFLQVVASDTAQKVTINWNPDINAPQTTGYALQRKTGVPGAPTSYVTVTTTDANTFSFDDYDVELNHSYSYRVRTLCGPGLISHYSNEATAYVPATIPVELVSFNAKIIGTEVNLNWTTATETNNRGFDVERKQMESLQSTVGSQQWETIGFVEGRGTTTEAQTYSFVDEEMSSGRYHYRLKQIDFDGSYEYSNVVEVKINPVTEFVLEQNYPNPFNPTTKISWQSPVGSHQTLKVYDVLGNEVATLVDEYKEAGKYEIEFDASNLSSGVYFYQLQIGSFIQIRKMTVLK